MTTQAHPFRGTRDTSFCEDYDEVLAAVQLERNITTSVGGFALALALARGSDLIATVPERPALTRRGSPVASRNRASARLIADWPDGQRA